jgi:hypothetical protein
LDWKVPEVSVAITHCENFAVSENGDVLGIEGNGASGVDYWGDAS